MFKDSQIKSLNRPPTEILNEAVRLWGKSIKKLAWEQVELNMQHQSVGETKIFICPSGNACEMVELHNYKIQENGHDAQYGIARCLSCDKIYWSKI